MHQQPLGNPSLVSHSSANAGHVVSFNARTMRSDMAHGTLQAPPVTLPEMWGCACIGPLITYNQMVVRIELSDADVDRLFRALADATRRDIVRRTLVADASVTALADAYDMSFAAVQKHVAVLEEVGLVSKRNVGRERLVRSNPDQIARVRTLLKELETLWRLRFDQLDAVLEDTQDSEGGI